MSSTLSVHRLIGGGESFIHIQSGGQSNRQILIMSEHLTALDATFLELEEADESAHMHIGRSWSSILCPAVARPRARSCASTSRSGLGQLPRYRQRLSEPHTGGLSWPEWEDDPAFDLGKHVARAALPAPGGYEELQEWASGFFSQRLDRHRPLWEMAIVEGLADGRWALATKTHHCMVDGVGAVDIGHLMLDTTPDAAGRAETPQSDAVAPTPPPPTAPGSLARLARAGRGYCRSTRSSTRPRWESMARFTRVTRCAARDRRST